MQKILVFLVFIALLSCKNQETDTARPEIIGLASPIQLKGDTTLFYVTDYIPNYNRADSIQFPEGIIGTKLNDSVYFLIKKSKVRPLSVLSIYTDYGKECIPVFNRKKQKVIIQYIGNDSWENLRVIGSMNNWNRDNEGMNKINGIWQQEFLLEPGIYEYLFYSGGKEFQDLQNNQVIGNNSVLKVGKYLPEDLPFLQTVSYDDQIITLKADTLTDQIIVLWQNKLLESRKVKDLYNILIPKEAANEVRSYIRAYAGNEESIGNDILIPLQNGRVISDPETLTRKDKHTMLMYFLMVDRFFNGDSLNDEPVVDPEILPQANYYGGDITGVYKKLNEGYFQDLGINTLWLSPISQNPKSAYGLYPNPHTKFSGYHGYWPVSNIKVDYRFGTGDDLKLLVNSVHQKGMNILLDYVANHVHQEHPVYQLHPDWATSLYLPDGTLNTEKWDEQRLTTWFDTFLPTLDLRRKEVVNTMVDSAVFWLTEYNIDGFRHDATKHIDELYWRTLTEKVKQITGDASFFQIGETYGSPILISSYISSGMLDAQFDFNTYDNAVACFAGDNESFERLKSVLSDSWKYYGYHHLMGNITGNQDRARFISYAGGTIRLSEDTKYAGWTRKIGVGDPEGYQKLEMLHAFNMTIPGIPVIYYGDEIGIPGGNDPDNRRMMKFANLKEDEHRVKETVKKLANIRKNNMALLYGQTKIIITGTDCFAYTRTYFNNRILVVFNKSKTVQHCVVDLDIQESKPASEFGSKLKMEGTAVQVEIQPLSFDIIHF